MIKGFKEFILRGNVIDLAVAVVIGAAFSAVVTSIVTNVFNPIVGALFNAESLATAFQIQVGQGVVSLGAVLAAIIQFLIVAVVVYFAFVVPVNHLKKIAFIKKQQPTPETVTAPPSEAELLTEIRDLLARQQSTGSHDA